MSIHHHSRNGFIVGALIGAALLHGAAGQTPGQSVSPVPQDFGAFGDSVESVKETDFYKFFALEETGRERDAQGRDVTEFRPTAEKFRKLVSFNVTQRPGGGLVMLQLSLDREFVDSGDQGVFAADIAKSFILSGTPRTDLSKTKNLARQIEVGSYGMSKRPVILHADRNPTPSPSEAPIAGYAAYLGKQERWEQGLSGMRLTLKNENVKGRPTLIMTLNGSSP